MNEQNQPPAPTQNNPTAPVAIEPVKDAGIVQRITEKFKPSPIQVSWISVGFELGTQKASLIAAELKKRNIKETDDTSMWYRWNSDPSFRDWWTEQWFRFYEAQKHMLIAAGMKQAEADHEWWRDMMEFFGFLKPRDTGGAQPTSLTQINFMNEALSKAEKERGINE